MAITKTVRDLIDSIFKLSTPKPPATNQNSIPMITKLDKFSFGSSDHGDENSSKGNHFSTFYSDVASQSSSWPTSYSEILLTTAQNMNTALIEVDTTQTPVTTQAVCTNGTSTLLNLFQKSNDEINSNEG